MGDNTETREHFDGFLGGRTYDFLAGTTGYGRAYYRRAAQSLPVEAGMTLIDLGCGTGSLTMAMARKLGHSGRITGIDLADKQLSHARHKQLQTDLPIEFVKGSVAHLPFADASVDGISISQVLHALPPDIRQGMISEACRVLKPGGFFGIIEWSRPRFRLQCSYLGLVASQV